MEITSVGDPSAAESLLLSSSSSSSSSSCSGGDEKVVDEEAVNDLLEECWFFDNLFKRKPRMLRCYSDPCTSSKVSQEILNKNLDGGQNVNDGDGDGDGAVHRNLIRAPSLPPFIGRKKEGNQEKETNKMTRQSSSHDDHHQHLLQALPKPVFAGKKQATKEKESAATRSKINGRSLRPNLQRTPSLPPYFGREDNSRQEDIESDDTRMSKLIHQAFATSSDILSNPHTSKGLKRSCSISRYRPPRSSEVEINYNMRHLRVSRTRKSPSDLESDEVQGFKDLGFAFEKQELSPSVVNILPGLQEKNNNKREELKQNDKKMMMRKPYLSEAWLSQSQSQSQSCGPPPPQVPNWATQNSAQDMKAQIKFWARAVALASNVRQEC